MLAPAPHGHHVRRVPAACLPGNGGRGSLINLLIQVNCIGYLTLVSLGCLIINLLIGVIFFYLFSICPFSLSLFLCSVFFLLIFVSGCLTVYVFCFLIFFFLVSLPSPSLPLLPTSFLYSFLHLPLSPKEDTLMPIILILYYSFFRPLYPAFKAPFLLPS